MELKSDRRSNVPTPQIASTVNEIATVRAISVQQFVGTTWHDTRAPRRDERQLGPEDGVGNSSPATVAHEQLHAPGRADRRRAHRLDRGADAVRQLRRFGAGTCPCLNLGAYFHLGIFNEQFDFDGLHRVDSGSPPPPSLLPLLPPPSPPPSSPPPSPLPSPPPACRAMQWTPRRIYTTTTTTITTTTTTAATSAAATTTTTQNTADDGAALTTALFTATLAAALGAAGLPRDAVDAEARLHHHHYHHHHHRRHHHHRTTQNVTDYGLHMLVWAPVSV